MLQCLSHKVEVQHQLYKTSLEGKDASNGGSGDGAGELKSGCTAGHIGRVSLLRGGEGVLERFRFRSIELDGVACRGRCG